MADDADKSRSYDAFFLDAICQREKGNHDAAFDLLRHCVELDSTRSEAYYYLAQYYRNLKDRDRHLCCIQKRHSFALNRCEKYPVVSFPGHSIDLL